MRQNQSIHPGAGRAMNQPAIAAKPDILDVFEARAEARGYLWREGEFDLPTAVDKLQADAERDGLIARLGQDEIQQILARTFHAPPVAIAAIAPDPVFKQPPRHRAPKCTVDALMFQRCASTGLARCSVAHAPANCRAFDAAD